MVLWMVLIGGMSERAAFNQSSQGGKTTEELTSLLGSLGLGVAIAHGGLLLWLLRLVALHSLASCFFVRRCWRRPMLLAAGVSSVDRRPPRDGHQPCRSMANARGMRSESVECACEALGCARAQAKSSC